uniref:RAD51 paralog D n=1 Tax=Sinocyclocheilus grahami TaxID=75366 RepID=A0A672M3F5_SINGR
MVILREGVCPGINEEFIKALQSEDIKTVEDFVSCNPEELARKCSLSYALVAVRRVLLAQYTAFPVSGADLYEELLSSTAILSTGNPRSQTYMWRIHSIIWCTVERFGVIVFFFLRN